jgi:NADPH:quinone reductase
VLGFVTDPAAPGGLHRTDVPEPSPASDEAVVEVHAFSVQRGELSLLEMRADGWAPGQDVAGVVATAAADGTGPAVGTRVLGAADGGGWSERVVAPARRLAVLPDAVSFATGAAMPLSALTALRALRTGGSLLGRDVLVTGASGGVGHFALQLAGLAGARVTALVSGDSRLALVRELGADRAVTTLDDSSPQFHLVIDGVGGPVLLEAIHHLAPEGVIALYGLASGDTAPITLRDFASGMLGRIIGFALFATGDDFADDLGYLAGLAAVGRLRAEIGTPAPWDDTVPAIEEMRNRRTVGKTVLIVEDT